MGILNELSEDKEIEADKQKSTEVSSVVVSGTPMNLPTPQDFQDIKDRNQKNLVTRLFWNLVWGLIGLFVAFLIFYLILSILASG